MNSPTYDYYSDPVKSQDGAQRDAEKFLSGSQKFQESAQRDAEKVLKDIIDGKYSS